MLIMLSMNSIILSMTFMSMNHPISMGFILLLQTIMISIISSFFSHTFWFSYILFLIMVGGMLILFTYVTSIAANETFSLSSKSLMMIYVMSTVSVILALSINSSMLTPLLKLIDSVSSSSMNFITQENNIPLNKIYNKPSNMISLILINYLLFTLIVVVKITNLKSGPLRQKF